MAYDTDRVKNIVEKIIGEMGLNRKVTRVVYRNDYQDYRVILDGTHHCPIREKLVNVFVENQDEDVKREIEYLLSHAPELDEWDREEEATTEGGDYRSDVAVDNSADYDF